MVHVYTSFNNVADDEAEGPPDDKFVALVVPSGKVAEDLTAFVTLIDLSDLPDSLWPHIRPDGGNLRVTDDLDALVPHDMVWINRSAKTGAMFFKADLDTASDNDFRVQVLPDSNTKLANGDTNGRDATWADYEFFFDFHELDDRTGNGFDCALEDGATITDPTNPDWLVLAVDDAHGIARGITQFTSWSMGASIIFTDEGSSNAAIMSYSHEATSNSFRATMAHRSSDDFALWNISDSWATSASGAAVNGTRYRIACTHTGTTSRELFLDGVSIVEDAGPVAQKPSGGGPHVMYLGINDDDFNEEFVGRMTYVYLRDGILVDNWLLAEDLSWETPSSFYTIT